MSVMIFFYCKIDENKRVTKIYIDLYSAGTVDELQCGSSQLVKVDPENGLHGCGSSITHSCYSSRRLVERFA